MLIDSGLNFFRRCGFIKAITRLKWIVLFQYFKEPFAFKVWLGFRIEYLLHDLYKGPVCKMLKKYALVVAQIHD